MSATLLSPLWYRVAALRPQLKSGLTIARHVVRGEHWTVVSEPLSGRHHRFDDAAWTILAACDGRRTLDEVWTLLAQAAHDDPATQPTDFAATVANGAGGAPMPPRPAAPRRSAPTQDETLRVVAEAFSADLLLGDVRPEAAAILRRREQSAGARRRAGVNPLAFRVPLWDPDRFLNRCMDLVRPAFHPLAGALLLVLLALALLLALVHGEDFVRQTAQLGGSSRFWLMVWLAYPLIKAVHELAHAFAVKHFGGEVHALGVTLLMLTPVPYVDASAAAMQPSKWRRAIVAAAGLAMEAGLASLAFIAWVLLQPGLARDIATVVVTVAGVSTLIVNGNPFVRFDGYHVATDVLELPNLAPRSATWWRSWARRMVLGQRAGTPMRQAPGEHLWLVAYAPVAWAVQVVMMVSVAVLVSQWSGGLAAVLLIAMLWTQALGPLLKAMGWAFRAPELHGMRARALTAASLGLSGVGLLVFGMPLPHASHVPGLVWLDDNALLRPEVEGFIAVLDAADGATVQPGQVVAQLHNDQLQAQIEANEAELRSQRVDYVQRFATDAAGAAQVADRIAYLESEQSRLQLRARGLVLRAQAAGRLVLDPQRVRLGLHVPQGQVLGHVLPPANSPTGPLVRAFVSNAEIAQVGLHSVRAQVGLAPGGPDVPAVRVSEVPRAVTELPSAALGEAAGGAIALDPHDPQGRTAAEPRMQVDLRLPPGTVAPVGGRARVTFELGDATLAERASGALRRLFLSHVES